MTWIKLEPKNKTNVVSIFTAKKAKCLWCCDILRIPGFPLNHDGVCGICQQSPLYEGIVLGTGE